MKASKIAFFIKKIIDSDEEKLQLKWIYIIAFVNTILGLLLIGWKELTDSRGYVAAFDVICSGQLDLERTPVYPIFLGVIRAVVGTDLFYWGVVYMQSAVFLLSIRYFYRLVRLLGSQNCITFLITIFYCLVPGLVSWNNAILTESLAISGTVFLFYFAINGWKKAHIGSLVSFGCSLFILCMLRPSFLFLVPIFFCFWFISLFLKGKKIIACYGLSGVVLTAVLVLCYCTCFQKTYGVFTPSSIGTLNQYCVARQRNLLNPDVIENAMLKVDIEKIILAGRGETVDLYYIEFGQLREKYSLLDIHNAVSSSVKSNFGKFLVETVQIAGEIKKWNLFDTYVTKPVVKLKMRILYYFIAIYTLFLIVHICRNRKIPYLSLLVYMSGCGNLLFVLMGAQWEWTRLLTPSVPLFLLMFVQVVNSLKVKVAIRRNDRFQLG